MTRDEMGAVCASITSRAKPTPGPWTHSDGCIRNARGESIASSGNNRKVRGAELSASLDLAAAAPILLAALELALPCVAMHTADGARGWPQGTPTDEHGQPQFDRIAARIRAAIALATLGA